MNPNIPEDIQAQFNKLLRFKYSRRKQEEIIAELTSLIKDFSKESFVPFVMEIMDSINLRNELEIFKNLKSPMRQMAYLIDLFFSVEIDGTKSDISKKDWNKISLLLDEIEMTYFADIGFFKEEVQGNEDLDKISVSLLSFIEYFSNAQISFEEQTLERFERNCGTFNKEVNQLLGFSAIDAKTFYLHIRNIINNKLTKCCYYQIHPDEWPELTAQFIKRGVTDPYKWWDEPEMKDFKEYVKTPGYIFIHSKDELKADNLSDDSVNSLISFLQYKEDEKKGAIVYYADLNPFFDTPLIKLNNSSYFCPHSKLLIESLYNRINTILAQKLNEKYLQFRSYTLENKVKEIFLKLFGRKAQIITSYYVDDKRSEQDILIVFNKFYFIIEIKDNLFRAPMRDPLKAYEKIKSDFKNSIQYGYEQCKRVEDKIEEGRPFHIYASKSKKSLHLVNPSHIAEYFSIIVTQYKYGGIQTNLESLLTKPEESLYPWSVCVDDLEAFVLILKKLKKSISVSKFIEYLKYREPYHEHLICSDELELCGYYLNATEDFKKYAYHDSTFSTFPGMSDMFDAEYQNGLGFDNELDINAKKFYRVPDYKKDYVITNLSGEDLN